MMIGKTFHSSKSATPIGLRWLAEEFDLRAVLPLPGSEVSTGITKPLRGVPGRPDIYPTSYAPNDVWGHLRFAMRYEAIDLGVMAALFQAIDKAELESWIRGELTGIFARRAWYLFELLTGERLDIPDVPPTGYAPLLNPEIHVVSEGMRIPRQKIVDNLLGNRDYCPLIRRTSDLEGWMSQDFRRDYGEAVEGVSASTLDRAMQYLFTKETQSSFAIEGETASPDRARRFVQALQVAESFHVASKEAYVQLQKTIVDARFAQEDWRSVQNYVGSLAPDYSAIVHYVAPKPQDLSLLMDGWMHSVARVEASKVNAVCVAAIAGFGFVYLHPFEDGNGRIHRFLIHHSLAKLGFTPSGVLFPVSAAMLRNRHVYDQALEFFSKGMRALLTYSLDEVGRMEVVGETAGLYRYPDLTRQTEYLYRVIADTIATDMRSELAFIDKYDRAMEAVREVVEMPGVRASLLVRLILQNHGRLSKAKRGQFPELTDEEITAIEAAIDGDERERRQNDKL